MIADTLNILQEDSVELPIGYFDSIDAELPHLNLYYRIINKISKEEKYDLINLFSGFVEDKSFGFLMSGSVYWKKNTLKARVTLEVGLAAREFTHTIHYFGNNFYLQASDTIQW